MHTYIHTYIHAHVPSKGLGGTNTERYTACRVPHACSQSARHKDSRAVGQPPGQSSTWRRHLHHVMGRLSGLIHPSIPFIHPPLPTVYPSTYSSTPYRSAAVPACLARRHRPLVYQSLDRVSPAEVASRVLMHRLAWRDLCWACVRVYEWCGHGHRYGYGCVGEGASVNAHVAGGSAPCLLGVTAHRGCFEQTRLTTAVSLHRLHTCLQAQQRESLLSPDPPYPPAHSPHAVHNAPISSHPTVPRPCLTFPTPRCSVMARNQSARRAPAAEPNAPIALAPR